MKSFLYTNRHLIMGVLVGGIAVFVISAQTTEKRLDQIQGTLESSLATQLGETKKLVKIIGEGGTTKEIQKIIPNCTFEEQTTFDNGLLGLDSGLAIRELEQLDNIFAKCAPTQSVRRAVMVMELSKRIQNIELLIMQRKQVGGFSDYDAILQKLKSLQKAEDTLTQLSFDLVYLQREIIDILLKGESVSSDQAVILKQKGLSIRSEINKQASETREIRMSVLN